jgi:hypothetical protein
MPLPTANDVHVNRPLTNLSVAYLQNAQNFIARRAFPNVPVSKQSDSYFTFNRADFNRNEAEKRAPSTESAGGGYRLSTDTYRCDVYAIHKDIADQVRANSDNPLSPDRNAMNWNMHKLLIKQEVNWASTYFAGGVWTNDINGVASSAGSGEVIQWSDATNGDPIGDIRAAKTAVLLATGFEPNKLIIGQQVLDALVDHPDIVDRVKYSGGVGNQNPSKVNEQTLAQLFDLDEVMVMKAIQNTAGEALAEVSAFIGGKKALLVYAPPASGIEIPSAGYTFSWTGYLNAGNEFGIATSTFRLANLKSDRVESEIAMDFKLVSADLGYFWDTIVA